jgi:hypothetical protein
LKVLNYNVRFLTDQDEELKEDKDNDQIAEFPLKNTNNKMPSPEML